MAHPHNPQHREMSDESMVRNLAAQFEAIWPQERPIFASHSLPSHARILDAGCGTGEVIPQLADMYPGAKIVGVDLDEAHLERAGERCRAYGPRVQFQVGDALALPFPDGSFDLVVSRHVVHALPDAALAVREMARVAKPGGLLHVLAEDYGMLWCHPTPRDSDTFWQYAPKLYGPATGTELNVGRKMFSILTGLGLAEIGVHYVAVDTLRVPRETLARIWEAWRDGYSEPIALHTGWTLEDTRSRWEEMIACVRDPAGYALWLVPVWTARKP